MAASSLCGEDERKFQPVFVTNKEFTKDFRCSREAEHKVDVMVESILILKVAFIVRSCLIKLMS